MARDNSTENQPKISDLDTGSSKEQSGSDSGTRSDELDFVKLLGNGNASSSSDKRESFTASDEPLQIAAADNDFGSLIGTEKPAIKLLSTIANDKAWLEFPGDITKRENDPHAYPRELVRCETLGEPLSDEERLALRAWRQFPGIDSGSTFARNLAQKDILDRDSMTMEERGVLRSWEEFPDPDKGFDHARALSYLDNLDLPLPPIGFDGAERILDSQAKAELDAWKSFRNPDPKYDRPRELVQKLAPDDGTLTVEEKAELAGWIDYPGIDKNSASLRELTRKEYLDPDNGLKPTEIAELEAARKFDISDKGLTFARNLAQRHIQANYNVEGVNPLSPAEAAELKAWSSLPNSDKDFDQARKLIKAETMGAKLSIEEETVIAKAYNKPAPVNDNIRYDPDYRTRYLSERPKPKESDPRKDLPGGRFM